jgi:hypothetical protein
LLPPLLFSSCCQLSCSTNCDENQK